MRTNLLRLATIAATAISCFAAQPAVVGHATSPWTAGTLFIADQGLHNGNDGAVYSLAPGGSPSTIAAGTITDVNADSAGNVYFSDCNSGKAWEYMPSVPSFTDLGTFNCPTAIAVDNAGNRLIGDFNGGGSLWMVPAGGGAPTLLESGFEPSSLQVDGAGNIWMAQGSNRIAVMVGGAAPILIQGLADEGSTNSIRLDSQGNVFASTSFFDNAIEIPTDGSATTTFGSGSDFSHGIATNGAGTVFIGKPGVGSVVKVVGGVQTTVASGLDYPQGLAIFPSISASSRQSSTTALTTTSSTTVSTITTVHLKAMVSSAGSTGGLVQFSSNQQPLGNAVPTSGGVASFNTTLPAGTDKVTATFLGNTATYPSISSTLTFTVNQLASHTALTTGSPSSIPGDQMVHVTATVTGSHSRIPTGEVEFKIGSRIMAVGTLDGTGVTTQSFFLPPGTSNVVAHYLGDPIFKGSKSNAITFTTTPPYTPSITTKVSYGTPRLNQSVKVTILVTVKGVVGNGAPTGSVTADSSFVCTALTPGTGISSTAKCTHVVPFGTLETVTVTYSGDSTYDGGTATAQVENGGG